MYTHVYILYVLYKYAFVRCNIQNASIILITFAIHRHCIEYFHQFTLFYYIEDNIACTHDTRVNIIFLSLFTFSRTIYTIYVCDTYTRVHAHIHIVILRSAKQQGKFPVTFLLFVSKRGKIILYTAPLYSAHNVTRILHFFF